MFECITQDLEGDVPSGDFDSDSEYTVARIYRKKIKVENSTTYEYYEYHERIQNGKSYFVKLNTFYEASNYVEFTRLLADEVADYLLKHNA
jgi:hypothetical protein